MMAAGQGWVPKYRAVNVPPQPRLAKRCCCCEVGALPSHTGHATWRKAAGGSAEVLTTAEEQSEPPAWPKVTKVSTRCGRERSGDCLKPTRHSDSDIATLATITAASLRLLQQGCTASLAGNVLRQRALLLRCTAAPPSANRSSCTWWSCTAWALDPRCPKGISPACYEL